MKIADVQIGTEYVVNAWRTNVVRATATKIVTRDEGTVRQPRNVRVVEMKVTRVGRAFGVARNSHKVGDSLVLPARDLKATAAQADATQRAREERDHAEREAIHALEVAFTEAGFPGMITGYGRAVEATFSLEEAHEFAQFLTATVTKAREFDLTEAEIAP